MIEVMSTAATTETEAPPPSAPPAALPSPSERFLALLSALPRRSIALKDGEALHRPGDAAASVYLLAKGRIRLTAPDGRLLHEAWPGGFFGESALTRANWPHAATAQGRSLVIAHDKAAFLALMQADPGFALGMAGLLARQLDRARAFHALIRLSSAAERVMGAMALEANSAGRVRLGRPLRQLAAEIGLSQEALYRTLSSLERNHRLTRLGQREFRIGSDF